MKRKGNIYAGIWDMQNLILADQKARRGKRHQKGVIEFDKDKEVKLVELQQMLINKTYKTSVYTTFTMKESGKKERLISRLPYFPDRIVHHAIMNKWQFHFTNDTYSCIKGKGIISALQALNKGLKEVYCLKIDIKKFYQNVDNTILKQMLRRRIKDKYFLWLLDEIIDSAIGLPLGNYLSQQFANFYITLFDRWIKEEKRVSRYFRYMDDMVFLANSKEYLHKLLEEIKKYLWDNLKLVVKSNYQIFPIIKRGVDFVGFVSFPDHIKIRKGTKKRYIRMMRKDRNPQSEASYLGWFKWCNSKNLVRSVSYNCEAI